MECNNFYSSENLHCQEIYKYTNGESRQAQVEKRAVTDRHQDTCLRVISFTYGFQRQKLISQRFSYQHFPSLPAANLIFSFCMASSKQCLFSLWGYLRGLTPPHTSCSPLSRAEMEGWSRQRPDMPKKTLKIVTVEVILLCVTSSCHIFSAKGRTQCLGYKGPQRAEPWWVICFCIR